MIFTKKLKLATIFKIVTILRTVCIKNRKLSELETIITIAATFAIFVNLDETHALFYRIFLRSLVMLRCVVHQMKMMTT